MKLSFNPKVYVTLVIIAFVLLNLPLILSSQADSTFSEEVTPTDLSNPREAVYHHLKYLQSENYKPGRAAEALALENPNSDEAKQLAEHLIKIYDGLGLFIEISEIPDNSNYIDSTSGRHKYTPFPNEEPDIYLVKIGDDWKYSEYTIKNIPQIYERVYPFETGKLVVSLPDWTQDKYAGIYVWQYLGIVLFMIFGIAFYKIFSFLVGFVIIRLIKSSKYKDVADQFIAPVARPVSMALVVYLIIQFLPILQFPVQVQSILIKWISMLIPILFTVVAYRLTDLVGDILGKLASKTATNVDDNLVPLARKTMKVIVIVIGTFYVLKVLDIDITPLLAGVSVGGLAFALAAQDTIKNFFGSVTIFTDQPFEIGDWIVFDGSEGTVEEVGVRSSRVRTFHNSVISIPNGKLADLKIDNMGRRKYRRYSTNISLTYDTPPDLIDAYVTGLKKIVADHPDTWKDFYLINLNSFGDSSLNILVYIFFDVPDWPKELTARHEFISEAIRLADAMGVRFAFPTTTIHVEDLPGQKSLTPEYQVKTQEEFRKKVKEYFSNKKKYSLEESDPTELKPGSSRGLEDSKGD